MAKDLKRLNTILKQYGLEYRRHSKHAGIHRVSDDVKILTCSNTASDAYWWRQVIRDLIKYKHIPPGRYW